MLCCNGVAYKSATDWPVFGIVHAKGAGAAIYGISCPNDMLFTRTCESTRKLSLTLRNLGFGAVPIHGQMSQPKRLGALNKFKSGERNILVGSHYTISHHLHLCMHVEAESLTM
eukprot:scaffold338211_cov21-Prasinocladus_malaysianus.AAC.1